ncbi:o-succinylbenzoate--CoA ligase [Tsukamurella sp. 8F]|uniref:o-succinylbenzoate--CoA ligase n=1 Tax=unclassified Tsukamurella TaxID=2633480 RepID=UPI0023B88B28|nr:MULTISPECIES: o-succinylbenzoate--CoA ligase [unclassified Tsukamurella]MDF0531647.1 o-succinylbenzoate--CoA ligase [Tsukamurella sp. 8J]MDF0588785.1 o-succinylbenzoate--CoA ligase [Tsukamurella sp. 8F]
MNLTPLPIDTVESALSGLTALLDGAAPALLPVPARDPREAARLTNALGAGSPIDDRAALVVATSGTTGTPKGAMLTHEALLASASGTHERLGGAGQWLLAMPPHHVAGVQVMLRSLGAGYTPVGIDVAEGFAPSSLEDGMTRMTAPRRYVSLVPTQLIKVLADPAATAVLAEFDGVLIGGAACPPPVREAALAAGVRMVRTYGMSETCGGCVYDGLALPGVRVALDGDSRVWLGGATVALGYRGRPDHPAFARSGWFRTDDAGALSTEGVLSVTGRLDEAISTGGLTVLPQVVETALAGAPGVREVAVFGLPDPRLGQRVVAAVVGSATLDELRETVTATLDRTAAPREVFHVDELPRRGPGKIDRRALVERFGGR